VSPRDPPSKPRHVRPSKTFDAALRAGGSRPDLVANTSITIADLAHFPDLNHLFAEFFPADPPARMVIQAPLPRGLLISIGCVAAVEDTPA
jgi:2-iminobutanoate/2-iminopropanoate deaminase